MVRLAGLPASGRTLPSRDLEQDLFTSALHVDGLDPLIKVVATCAIFALNVSVVLLVPLYEGTGKPAAG
jgi:hypothetical protein